MADWSAAGDFEKAAKPGDLVDEEIVEEFVNCLPPTTLRGDLVQAGEPYSHQYDPEAERWRATYTTFAKVDGEWTYNDPLSYAELILNGDPELYLKTVTKKTPLD